MTFDVNHVTVRRSSLSLTTIMYFHLAEARNILSRRNSRGLKTEVSKNDLPIADGESFVVTEGRTGTDHDQSPKNLRKLLATESLSRHETDDARKPKGMGTQEKEEIKKWDLQFGARPKEFLERAEHEVKSTCCTDIRDVEVDFDKERRNAGNTTKDATNTADQNVAELEKKDNQGKCKTRNGNITKQDSSSDNKATKDKTTECSKANTYDEVPNEDWAKHIYDLHEDKQTARILIESERENREVVGEVEKDTVTVKAGITKWQKYAIINDKIIEITDELYDVINDIQVKRRTKQNAVAKEREELQELYGFFRPSQTIPLHWNDVDNNPFQNVDTIFDVKGPKVGSLEATRLTQSSKSRSRLRQFVEAMSSFRQRCRKLFTCNSKQSNN